MLKKPIQKLKKILYKLTVSYPKYIVFKKLFSFWQILGFHLVNNQFYEPIPDTRTLSLKIWHNNSNLNGINIDTSKQLRLLKTFKKNYGKEYASFPLDRLEGQDIFLNNGSFESVDSEILYAFIRYFNPKKIIEIGSGFSSLIIINALEKNGESKFPINFKIIDPYKSDLSDLVALPTFTKLIRRKVQEVQLSEFKKLKKNDILFIDSTHILSIGSDVWFIFGKILPNLNKGVIVHFHDIFLPNEYSKKQVLDNYYFFNEQYILHSFLAFNNSFEVLWSGAYMNIKYPKSLRSAFKSYSKKTSPASFWIKKIK